MEPVSSQPQPPKNSRKRWVFIAVGVLVVLCLCVAVAGNRDQDTVGTASQPTAQPIVETQAQQSVQPAVATATPAPPADTPTPVPPTVTPTIKEVIVDAMGQRNRDGVPDTVVEMDTETMVVTFPINDSLTANGIRSQARADALDAARAVYQATGNAYDLTLDGTFAMQDAYGNVEETRVMRAQLTRAILDKINWENLTAVDLSLIADYYWEHPGFSK